MLPSYILIVLILCCIVGIVCAIWFNCCMRLHIQRRIDRTYNTNIHSRRGPANISDNYLFSGVRDNYNTSSSENDRTVPNIVPIAIGEKVDLEFHGIIVIIADTVILWT